MNQKIIISFLIIILQSVLASPQELSIDPDSIENSLQFLASDELQGRGTGTIGGNLAAQYISEKYKQYGLKTVGSSTSYFQNIPMHGSYPKASSELILFQGNQETNLRFGDDYLLYKTGQQTYLPVPVELVFVSYGIIAPEFNYNDYQSVDVSGKIVVFIDGEPESESEEFFKGEQTTVYSYAESKQRIALSRGAAGSILIQLSENTNWQQKINEFYFEDVMLAYSATSQLGLLLNSKLNELIFTNSDYSYEDIIEMKINNNLRSFPLNTSLSFKGAFKERDFISPNICGMVEGTDEELKDSYIIISAHYDHLGIGVPIEGDSIYNGALDNAIGISVLLELAREYATTKNKIRRSLIFLAVTAEEKGLLGSYYYTDNPLVPLYKTVANINIDGIAMFKDFYSIIGVGGEYSTLINYLSKTANKLNLIVDEIPNQFRKYESYNESDQLSFANAGIPSILILEGLKNRHRTEEEVMNKFIDYIVNRYHSPKDDLNQDIDYAAAVQNSEFLFEFILNIANADNAPEWNSDAPFLNARLKSIAEKK